MEILILTSWNKSISFNMFSIFVISLFSLTVRYSTNSSFLLLSHLTGWEIFVFSVDSKIIFIYNNNTSRFMLKYFSSFSNMLKPSGIFKMSYLSVEWLYPFQWLTFLLSHVRWLFFSSSSEGGPVGIFKCGSRKEKYVGSVTI